MSWIERERTAAFLVGLAATLVFLNTVPNEFVFDDLAIVVWNPIVQQAKYIFHAFAADYWRGASEDLLYRPLTVFSFGLGRLVHGSAPWGFHLVNVLLHAAVSALAYRLVLRLFEKPWLALATGFLFAVHPIHADAVASVVGRAELLMALFALLAIWYYLKARGSQFQKGRRYFLVCAACYVLACLAKENGIATPALILIAEISVCLRSGDWTSFRGQPLRRAVWAYATLAAAGCAYVVLRYAVLGELTIAQRAQKHSMSFRGLLIGWPWHLQFANALQFFARYLGLLLFPWKLSSDWSYEQFPLHASVWHWDIALGAVGLAVLLGGLGYSILRARPPIFFGLGFFLVAFLPVSNFIIPIMTILAERLMYLPSLGLILAAASVWSDALQRVHAKSADGADALYDKLIRPVVAAGLIFIVAFFAIRTLFRNADWRNERTLFSSAVRVAPNCANAHSCLGDALFALGRFEEAIVAYDRALEIIPDHGRVHYLRANALREAGRVQEAIEAYKTALRHAPTIADACDQLGRHYVKMGNLDEALRYALRAVALQPEKATYHYNLGYVLQQRGQLLLALEQYREAAEFNPDEPSYAFNLGLAFVGLGDLDNALIHLQRAVELSPQNEKYWMTLSDALLKKGALGPAALALEEFVKVSTNTVMIAKAKDILGQIRADNQ